MRVTLVALCVAAVTGIASATVLFGRIGLGLGLALVALFASAVASQAAAMARRA